MLTALSNAAEVLQNVAFPGYTFQIEGSFQGDEATYLQALFYAPDCKTGHLVKQRTRKWLLSPHMTPSELVQTAFKCVLASIEHETRERFTYLGQPIFGPHFDVNDLVKLCAAGRDTAGGRTS